MMRKKIKPRPSVPNRDFIHFGMFDDNCWGCKNITKCNNCPRAREYNEIERRKEIKKSRNKNYLKDNDY